jgi:hypothetical protein
VQQGKKLAFKAEHKIRVQSLEGYTTDAPVDGRLRLTGIILEY